MANPDLSIVIPAYNEESRLPRTLERLFVYMTALGRPYEIVISDDGSRDNTVPLVRELSATHPELCLISDGVNRGRGDAVKRGIAAATGAVILETDSDGSVADEAIGRFLSAFDADPSLDAVFGSRELPDSHIAVWQPFLRVFLGYGFLYLTRALFLMPRVTDFTLGFKMYRKEAARDIFTHQYDPFYVAEAEKVYVAHIRGHKSIELPVTWTDDPDSRVRPFRDTFRSLKGLAAIVGRRLAGKYR
jgi:dolichyl-phosphate beta-glucosyltransferase